jgi:TRAP-type C4-dicarboxylate transport system permease small subunit
VTDTRLRSDAPARQTGILARIETALLCVLLFGIVAVAAVQIVLRLLLSGSLFWASDLISMAVLWLAVIGATTASREGRHIAIGIVPRYFPEAWHKPAAVTAMLFAAVVTGILAWQSARFVLLTREFQDRFLWDLPAWWFQLILPAGFAVMSVRFARHAVSAWKGRA